MLVIANLLTVEAQEKQENIITNPFLQAYDTPYNVPPFDKIKNEHFKPAILEGIKRHEAEINAITNAAAEPTFDNTILAIWKMPANYCRM